MGWTKKQLVTQAFEELGLSASVYDITPAQLETAVNKLNSMMALWSLNGVRVGWSSPSTQKLEDINQDSSLPDFANEAVYTNLAVRLASSFGKQVSPELRSLAISSYSQLVAALVKYPNNINFPSTLPRGAGYKNRSSTFYTPSPSALLADEGNEFRFD